MAASDVKKAYYQTPFAGDVRLRLPKYLRPYKGFTGGQVVGLARVIPGLPEGAFEWLEYFRSQLKTKGYLEVVPGFFRKDSKEFLVFMDDLLFGRQFKQIYDDVKELVDLDE